MREQAGGVGDLPAQQAALFVRQVPALVVMNLTLATFVAWNAAALKSAIVVGTWLGVAYGLTVLRVAVLMRLRAQRKRGHAPASARLLIALSLLSGVTWGAAGCLFFESADPSSVLLLGLVLAGVSARAIASMAAIWPAYLSCSVASVLPFAARALHEGGAFTVVGGLMLFLLAFNIVFARNAHRVVCKCIELSRQNIDLIRKLERESARAFGLVRAKGEFLAAASHELRQPTHALGLHIHALHNIAAAPEACREQLGRVAQQMQRSLEGLTQLLSTLLDMSKLDAGTIEPCMGPVSIDGLFDVLEGDFAAPAAARGLRLIVVPSDIWVWSDSVLLRMIVANFVSNAIRYTARGGVLVAARRRGRAVEIQVYDTGIGIPDAERDLVFREFHQASNAVTLGMNNAGVGLGLAIATKSADLIGARMKVRSRIGRGSMFSVEVESTSRREPSKMPSGLRLAREARTILVLDDDQQVLSALELILCQWGYDVIAASSPADALARIASSTRSPDLLISDLGALGGDVDIERLRSAAAAGGGVLPPVLLVTGHTDPERILQARATGHEVLHKPVPPALLAKSIEQQLVRATSTQRIASVR